ncbi:MAG: hypothetical protein HY390_02345 [Deltaproteobacteria bacterium]|nr:hypothetical protein [Deltaproteobacteria bacterium]
MRILLNRMVFASVVLSSSLLFAKGLQPEWKNLEPKVLTSTQEKALSTINEIYAYLNEGPEAQGAIEINRNADDQDEVTYAFLTGVASGKKDKIKFQREALERLSKVIFKKNIFDRQVSEDQVEVENIEVTRAVVELLDCSGGGTREDEFLAIQKLNEALSEFQSTSLNVQMVRVSFSQEDYEEIYRFFLIQPQKRSISKRWILGISTRNID